jgi:hypothetical protein
MKIIVQQEDSVAEHMEISLCDENFNVPGWVTIRVGNQTEDVHIDELHHACVALYSKYRNELDKEAA